MIAVRRGLSERNRQFWSDLMITVYFFKLFSPPELGPTIEFLSKNIVLFYDINFPWVKNGENNGLKNIVLTVPSSVHYPATAFEMVSGALLRL